MISIEACLAEHSVAPAETIARRVRELLCASGSVHEGQFLDLSLDQALQNELRHVRVADMSSSATDGVCMSTAIHVHRLYDEEAAEETADDDEDSNIAFSMWTLPSLEFDGLWESLIYDEDVKPKLLRYVSAAMRFSELGVDSRVISWNRVVLLHGPPGTGKTSLCKGLAHKLAIRMSHRYTQGHLIEVNAHSLFSKWFSESGKMVLGMFTKIREILEDGDSFVCVLIDEVESLTAARQAAVSGSEPSDAVRVVNALLTQLDGLRRYQNALVLTTSNLTAAIDPAFVDRADIKQFVGQPGVRARYQILASCLIELGRAGVLATCGLFLSFEDLKPVLPTPPPTFAVVQRLEVNNPSELGPKHSMMLYAIAESCDGLSGRALRKLPFIAHALYAPDADGTDVETFLCALARGVQHERDARTALHA
ncbi:hypothetical protein AB1Y20_009867 [Prymnesium parvum]|uniref:AAA+ ATPase domain-containing protein n=1 Tax=Prymnesium parvum TaxID=97485 RepID=A0AB34K1M3_PRYPA